MKVLTKRSVAMVGLALAVMCCAAAAPPQFGKTGGLGGGGGKGIALSGGGNAFSKGSNALSAAKGNPRSGANAIGGGKSNAQKRNPAGPRENTRAAASQERNKGNARNVKSPPKRSEGGAQHSPPRPQQTRRPAESGQRLSTSPSGKPSSVRSATTQGNPPTKTQHVQRPTNLRPNDTHQRPTDLQAKRPVVAGAEQANHSNAVPKIHSVQRPTNLRPNDTHQRPTDLQAKRPVVAGAEQANRSNAVPKIHSVQKPTLGGLASSTGDARRPTAKTGTNDHPRRNQDDKGQTQVKSVSTKEVEKNRAQRLGTLDPKQQTAIQGKTFALSAANQKAQNQPLGQGGVLGGWSDAGSGYSSASGGSQASQIAEGVLQIVGGAIGGLGSASGASQGGSPMAEPEEGGWGTYQGSSRGTISAASGSGRGRGRVVPVSTSSQAAMPARTGGQHRVIASTDMDLEAAASAPGRRTTRYLRIVNASGEKVTVFLRYFTQDQSQAWNWFPGTPGDESAEPLTFEFEPGETADLSDNEWRINAGRVRLWGQAASGKQWLKFKDQDFLLVPEVGEDGQHSYRADEIGVCSFTVK